MMKRRFILIIGMLSALALLTACDFSLAADVTPPPGVNTMPPTSQSVESASSGPTYPLVSPNPASGASIYAEKCAPCHGDQGMGNGAQAAQLPNPVPAIGRPDIAENARPADWYDIITNGNIERFMPPFASLTAGQRWDVIAYVFSLSSSQEEVAAGAALYEANCAACHGPSGRGDGAQAAGLPVSPTNFTDQELMSTRSNAEMANAISAGVGESMPAFSQFNASELANLSAYLRSLTFASQPAAAEEQASQAGTAADPSDEGSSDTTSNGSTGEQSAPETAGLVLGQVAGRVTNASGGDLPEEAQVTLHALDHMQVVYTKTTTLNADGSYVFNEVEFPEDRVYVVTLDHGGTTYGSDVAIVEAGSDRIELPLTVYDTTTDKSVLAVDRLHVFFDFSRPNVVQVVQLYVISNPTNNTVVGDSLGAPIVEFTLPEGASNLQFQDGALGERYIETQDGFADTFAVRPGQGEYQVMYAFDMPYEDKVDIEQSFQMPIDAMIVMTPAEGVKLRSDYLQQTGTRDVQGEVFQMYTGNQLPAGQQFSFTLSGLPGETGMLNLTSSDNTTGMVVGLAAFGLALVGVGVWLFRRNANGSVEEVEDLPVEDLPDDNGYTDPETIMDAIITLDDLYAAGELPEEAYVQRRAELKEQLRRLTES
jgi:mono/diheme cytochrome c family protein